MCNAAEIDDKITQHEHDRNHQHGDQAKTQIKGLCPGSTADFPEQQDREEYIVYQFIRLLEESVTGNPEMFEQNAQGNEDKDGKKGIKQNHNRTFTSSWDGPADCVVLNNSLLLQPQHGRTFQGIKNK